jgi:hypothetical protein
VTGESGNVDRRPTTADSHNAGRTTARAVGDADSCSDSCGNCDHERDSATTSALPLARFFDQGIGIRR